MDYFKKIRKVLTNYPPVSKNLRVYLDPEICGIDEEYATSTQSVVTIVDTNNSEPAVMNSNEMVETDSIEVME